MPEAHTPCANCGATDPMHADPEIETCPSYMPMADTPPAPPTTIPATEAERILAEGANQMRAVVSKLEAQVDQIVADLVLTTAALAEAEAVNMLWGAFDYELLLMADEANLDAEGLTPLDLVRALVAAAAAGAVMEGAP